MVKYTGADIRTKNSHSFGSDRVHPHGTLLETDLRDTLPFRDDLELLRPTGAQVRKGLENNVSEHPTLEG